MVPQFVDTVTRVPSGTTLPYWSEIAKLVICEVDMPSATICTGEAVSVIVPEGTSALKLSFAGDAV